MCNWQVTAIMNEQLETHYAWDVLTYSQMPSVFQRSGQALAQSWLPWKSRSGWGWALNRARAHFSTGDHFQLLPCNKNKCLWNEMLPLSIPPSQARGQNKGGLDVTRRYRTEQASGVSRFWDQLHGLSCIFSWAQTMCQAVYQMLYFYDLTDRCPGAWLMGHLHWHHLGALYKGLIPTLDLSLTLVLGVASFPAPTRCFLATLGY